MQKFTSAQKLITASLIFSLFLTQVPPSAYGAASGNGSGNRSSAASPVKGWPQEAKDLKETTVSLNRLLGEIETSLEEGKDVSSKLKNLRAKRRQFQAADRRVRDRFSRGRSSLQRKGASAKVLQGHDRFVARYREKSEAILNSLKQVERSRPKNRKLKVKDARKILDSSIYKPKPASPPGRPLPRIKLLKPPTTESMPKLPRPEKPKIRRLPHARKRKKMSFLFGTIREFFSCTPAYATGTDYLGPTPEVQCTAQEIIDLANDLGKNPVKIYEFVRNNFTYQPYYGSLKGSIGTLHTGAGNDIDQASLLIALLRAAEIPARYVIGNVWIPADKAQSWLGLDHPGTAAAVLTTYGVPLTAYIEGGQVSWIEMEHCWVEACVDYTPSGGAVNKTADLWVPLDPGFKALNVHEGEDITGEGAGKVMFDENGCLHLDPATGQDALDFYLDDLQAEVDEINSTLPPEEQKSLFDYSRVAVIEPEYLGILPATLAYYVGGEGIPDPVSYDTIPDELRHKLSVTVSGWVEYCQEEGAISHTFSLVELVEKRLTISYVSVSDCEYLITKEGDNLYDISNPNISAVRVRPLIKLDGELKAEWPDDDYLYGLALGSEQTLRLDFHWPKCQSPGFTQEEERTILAGSFHSICCTWPSANGQSMMGMSDRLNGNITSIGDAFIPAGSLYLSEELTGDFLQLQAQSWLTQMALTKELASSFLHLPVFQGVDVVIAGVEVQPVTWLGIPGGVALSGLRIDAIRDVTLVLPKDGEKWKHKEFMTITGYAGSALEHFVWERKYEPGAVSAVKAIQTAYAQEPPIPVHDIDENTPDYQGLINGFSISQAAKDDLINSINAGMTVKTPESDVSVSGWTGVGYIVQDPETGVGRYEIMPGGVSGGWFSYEGTAETEHWAVAFIAYTTYWKDILWGKRMGHARYVAKQIANRGYLVLYGEPYSKRWLLYWINSNCFEIFYIDTHGGIPGQSFPIDARREDTLDGWIFNHEIDVDPETFKLVFLNGCSMAAASGFADAFHIDYSDDNADRNNHEAYIGCNQDIHIPEHFAKKFWNLFGKGNTIYECATEGLSSSYLPPYGGVTLDGVDYPIWWNPSVEYWNFNLP